MPAPFGMWDCYIGYFGEMEVTLENKLTDETRPSAKSEDKMEIINR